MARLVFFFLMIFLWNCKSSNHQPKISTTELWQHDTLSLEELGKIQNGDIILRKGFGLVSDMIASANGDSTPFTHSGVIFKEQYQFYVIHSESNDEINGMQKVPLSQFLRDSEPKSVAVVRLLSSKKQIQSFTELCYDYYVRKVPFDKSFNLKDTTELYCTELLYQAFYKVFRQDYFPDKTPLDGLRLQNLVHKDRFTAIVNHTKNQL